MNMWKSCNKWSEQQKIEHSRVVDKINKSQGEKEEKERKENVIKNSRIDKNKSETDTKNIKKLTI